MGRLTQEFTEVVATATDQGRLSQEFVEVAATVPAEARLSQEFAEVAATATASFRLTQMFIEVVCVPGTGEYGIWPQERLLIQKGVQGQRFQRKRGLP